MAELDKEISRNQKELEQHGRGDAGQAMVLCNLALSLHNQYKQTGEIMDLNECWTALHWVILISITYSSVLHLSMCLEVISLSRAALDLCPMGNSDHAIALSNLAGDLRLSLANFLCDWYNKWATLLDLEEPITLN
ncbi:hypothetical protein V8B97DRAFT_1919145 [Scleroderma yunnanense]